MINLEGGVRECELWECLHPSGFIYDFSGETAEEHYSTLHSEEALSEVFSQTCVCLGVNDYTAVQFVCLQLPFGEGHGSENTDTECVWRGDVRCFSDVRSHLSHPLMLFLTPSMPVVMETTLRAAAAGNILSLSVSLSKRSPW